MTDGRAFVPVAQPLRGRVILPGSKSISNRVLLLAALARGTSRISGALKSDDTLHMVTALSAMGVAIAEPDATTFVVAGTGQLSPAPEPLFLGNAGTAVRFLTAAATLIDGRVALDGDAHMRKRPIAPLVAGLRTLGADVVAPSGCPPVTVEGRGGLDGGRVIIDARLSSQYVSAILMLAPRCRGPVELVLDGEDIGARGYIDLTIDAMRRFGGEVERTHDGRWLVQPADYRATDLEVEPDASAATYLWAAEALTDGDIDIGLAPEALTQPDARAHRLIRQFPDLPPSIDGSQMQDAVPTLAVLAAFNARPVRFTGIANLRVKECDRIAAMAAGLCGLAPSLAVEDGDDLIVSPVRSDAFRPARIDTRGDHRIAMSMALMGLRVPGVTILDPECVRKTYPNFWRDMTSLGVATAL